MVAHYDNFSRGIAMVLQGESLKAGCYVTHGPSLGVLREKMVSSFVRHETPDRFRVATGFIHNHTHKQTSRQCDILIYDSNIVAPLYRWEDFVVVQASQARAVIEVKSNLEEANFKQFLDIHTSIAKLECGGQVSIPTLGYGIIGVTFDTFLTYIQNAIEENRLDVSAEDKHLNWPVCVAVQNRNYLGIRSCGGKSDVPHVFCVVDFSKAIDKSAQPIDGIETGVFLYWYTKILESGLHALEALALYEWFNRLPIAPEGKAWVTPDGVIHRDLIPLPNPCGLDDRSPA